MKTCTQPRPLSLRISVTDRCQLCCRYCVPSGGVSCVERDDMLSFEEIVRFVRILKRHFSLSKVRLTGGEPLLRPGIVDLVGMLADEGIADLALTTNAQRLAGRARELKRAGLGRVNVSLDTLDPDTFRWLTRGGELGPTLDGIDAALEAGLRPVRLNVVVLRGVNDHELANLVMLGSECGCEVRFLELMPIGEAANYSERWFVPAAEVHEKLSPEFTLRPLPVVRGSTSREYLARNGNGCEGVIGFISSRTGPFCRSCRRLRLTATGRLLGCLARGEGPDLRPLLHGEGSAVERQLAEAVEGALQLKRRTRRFARQETMVKVGG